MILIVTFSHPLNHAPTLRPCCWLSNVFLGRLMVERYPERQEDQNDFDRIWIPLQIFRFRPCAEFISHLLPIRRKICSFLQFLTPGCGRMLSAGRFTSAAVGHRSRCNVGGQTSSPSPTITNPQWHSLFSACPMQLDSVRITNRLTARIIWQPSVLFNVIHSSFQAAESHLRWRRITASEDEEIRSTFLAKSLRNF